MLRKKYEFQKIITKILTNKHTFEWLDLNLIFKSSYFNHFLLNWCFFFPSMYVKSLKVFNILCEHGKKLEMNSMNRKLLHLKWSTFMTQIGFLVYPKCTYCCKWHDYVTITFQHSSTQKKCPIGSWNLIAWLFKMSKLVKFI